MTTPTPKEMDESGLRFMIQLMEAETSTFVDEKDFVMAARCARNLAEMCEELASRLPPQESVGY